MTTKRETWRRVAAAVIVAGGLAVVWGALFGWGASLAETFFGFGKRNNVNENIVVAMDGTPVIISQSLTGWQYVELSRRTLDGKPWPKGYRRWLNGESLIARQQPPGLFRLPISWSNWSRVGGVTDGDSPQTTWYLIRDGEPAGRCYLSGFNTLSKLPVGMLGRNGLRETIPAKEDQFSLPDTNVDQLMPFVASTQYVEWSRIANNNYLSEQSKPAGWLVFVAEGDRLWEVDLRQRTARVVLELPGILSIGMMQVPESIAQTAKATGEARQRSNTPFRLASATSDVVLYNTFVAESEEEGKYVGLVAIRTTDRVVVFDPSSGNKTEFKLPSELPAGSFNVFLLAPDKLLLEYHDVGQWSDGSVHLLAWIDTAGKIERQEQVNLAGFVPESPRAQAWQVSPLAPIPIAWLVGVAIGGPLTMLQDNKAADYASALHTMVNIAWPPLILVLVSSAALARVALRWQQKYHRSATGVWVTFVFLLGLPGLAAYWLEQRRAKLESCPKCEKVVPRDRETCAACDAAFPTPPLVGTEIFA